jgi:hypothetical protein
MCDDACVEIGDCCPDHEATCPNHYEEVWTPGSTTYSSYYYSTTEEPTTTAEPEPCVGFVQLPVHSKMSWKQAKRACRILGGELAYFQNEAELATFNELDFTEHTWLGMMRSKKGINFLDVENREPITVSNWNGGEPNNSGGDERCVEAYTNGKWNDQQCTDERQVTCRFVNDIYC